MAHMTTRTARRASVTVELALLLPLVMLLTTGLIEYGWLFLRVQQINSAARYGARVASLPDATNQSVAGAVRQELLRHGLSESGYSITMQPSDVSAPLSGEEITISVNVPYRNISLTGMPLLPLPDRILAAVTMSKEGP